MAYPRKEIVKPGIVADYHCISKLVRGWALFKDQEDHGAGQNRLKEIEQKRIERLSVYFGINVLSFSIMDTHTHITLRTRPDLVARWEDIDVARRWEMVSIREPDNPEALKKAENRAQLSAGNHERILILRSRLSDVSWFMRHLNEYVARNVNQIRQEPGRLWNGRFHCRRIEGEAALLTVQAYVDLNPFRAGIVGLPEEGRYTSLWLRTQAFKGRVLLAKIAERQTHGRECPNQTRTLALQAAGMDHWLAPLIEQAGHDGVFQHLGEKEYLRLIDKEARIRRNGKTGVLDREVRPIVVRMGINEEYWPQLSQLYEDHCRRVFGPASKLTLLALENGHKWFQGIQFCRAVFPEYSNIQGITESMAKASPMIQSSQ